ncbi:dual specificity protein phosphatase CDC14A-like [Rhopilema esculentum]|uniref:dual specificity protein phosphatase CDC14A-like n=1 Tax=Rhopilema esculentum TaxID=499914 RepID=UPI0031DA31F1
MGAYAVLYLNWSTRYTMEKMSCISNEAMSCFCDHNGSLRYRLSVSDCLDGIIIAVRKNGWFTLDGVDPLKNGLNMNWVIPNKIIAMKDPKAKQDDGKMAVDKRYMKELLKHGIDYLVRLNSKDFENDEKYGEAYLPDDVFAQGIGLYDFPIKDGGIPTQKQLNSFLEICSIAETQIAVHCHAGLGRTGTMIACYLIRDYGFTSRQAVAWLNMCRRGSVMGQQHDFLDRFYKEIQEEKLRHPVCVNVKDPEFVCCQSQAHSEEDENRSEITKYLNLDEPQIKKWRLDTL